MRYEDYIGVSPGAEEDSTGWIYDAINPYHKDVLTVEDIILNRILLISRLKRWHNICRIASADDLARAIRSTGATPMGCV